METLLCKDPMVRYDTLMFWTLIGIWIWIPIFSLIFLRPKREEQQQVLDSPKSEPDEYSQTNFPPSELEKKVL